MRIYGNFSMELSSFAKNPSVSLKLSFLKARKKGIKKKSLSFSDINKKASPKARFILFANRKIKF